MVTGCDLLLVNKKLPSCIFTKTKSKISGNSACFFSSFIHCHHLLTLKYVSLWGSMPLIENVYKWYLITMYILLSQKEKEEPTNLYTLCHRRTKVSYSVSLCKPASNWTKYKHQGLAHRQVTYCTLSHLHPSKAMFTLHVGLIIIIFLPLCESDLNFLFNSQIVFVRISSAAL